MTTATTEPSPLEIAAVLRDKPKLIKRLRACLHVGVPWIQAPKKHRQLYDLRLVHRGDDGTQEVAIATPFGQEVARLCQS